MTIAFFNTFYYPYQVGGAEVSVQILCEGLVKRNNKVYVISLGAKNCIRRINGVISIVLETKNIYNITEKDRQPAWKKMIWHWVDSKNFFYSAILKKLMLRIRPDVVNTNNIQGFSPYIWRILEKMNIPVIHTMRDYYLLCYRTTCYKNNQNCNGLCTSCALLFSIKKQFIPIPKAYIGISRFILEKHENYADFKHAIRAVIGNGVRKQTADFISFSYSKKSITIGFIGRITKEKGVELLLQELQALASNKNYKVLLAGAYEESYKNELITKYDLSQNFEFKGKMNPSEFYKSVDLVVVPSLWNEPFGRVPIEALSFQKPVCIINKGGLSELYEPSCMWQFTEAKGSLSHLLEKILNNPESIAEKAAHCREVLCKYDPDKIINDFEKLLNKVMTQNNAND